ncbi:hypothetical protein JCGZ_02041 [Jatropha curcas]|uniref:HMA domain-containing protein n=2 Tax=Jatropha curcas TaxID=180498 RepID=A0A067KYH7_JATCU|nr:hypothetical protein JCGZ_02041 [Jatropha curcas]
MEAEFKVSMHCNACERTVAKAISEFKGVETFWTDMKNHRVVVRGQIDPRKLLKQLKKKTGKRIEIVENEKEEEKKGSNGESDNQGHADSQVVECPQLLLDDCKEEVLMTFNDENPNACSIL